MSGGGGRRACSWRPPRKRAAQQRYRSGKMEGKISLDQFGSSYNAGDQQPADYVPPTVAPPGASGDVAVPVAQAVPQLQGSIGDGQYGSTAAPAPAPPASSSPLAGATGGRARCRRLPHSATSVGRRPLAAGWSCRPWSTSPGTPRLSSAAPTTSAAPACRVGGAAGREWPTNATDGHARKRLFLCVCNRLQ